MKIVALSVALLLASTQAFAAKPCEELKAEIGAKLDGKHVTGYALEIVPSAKTGTAKVIGSCDGGTKKIVYSKK